MELTNEELILLIKCTHVMSSHTPVKDSKYNDVLLISHKLEQEYKKRNYESE